MAIEKVYVRNERLWKVTLVYLMISIVLFVVGMRAGNLSLPLVNVFIALFFLVLAIRFRALKITCGGKAFVFIPDYSTSSFIIKGRDGKVLIREPFPLFEEKRVVTPCGPVVVSAIHHRFGKVELLIKAGERELRLP
ncbi:hypothetical protein [Thermococcus sp.]